MANLLEIEKKLNANSVFRFADDNYDYASEKVRGCKTTEEANALVKKLNAESHCYHHWATDDNGDKIESN